MVDGQEARRVTVYLQNSLYLDYEGISIVDIGGDAKSLVVALSHGTLQVFSWQGQVGGADSACRMSDMDGEVRRPCLHTYTHMCTDALASSASLAAAATGAEQPLGFRGRCTA